MVLPPLSQRYAEGGAKKLAQGYHFMVSCVRGTRAPYVCTTSTNYTPASNQIMQNRARPATYIGPYIETLVS